MDEVSGNSKTYAPGTSMMMAQRDLPRSSKKKAKSIRAQAKVYAASFLQSAQKLTDESNVATEYNSIAKVIAGIMHTQMSARVGIKKFGDRARDALRKEFKQMVDKSVYRATRKKGTHSGTD